MVYKTLHGYIFRELLRIFLLTASALTTLLAFGGMFKPLTRQGVEISQLLVIMMNLMPAMLAYAIPIAALFAAVLVYWRLATDNEMTACRASGISFVSIVLPALALGLLVASADLVFVNYVVPVFLQRTERAVISDLGSLLVGQINQQGQFTMGKLVVYADSAHQIPSDKPGDSIVILNGMAGMKVNKDGKPEAIVVAREARLTITNHEESGDAEIGVQLTDAAGFDPTTLKKVQGSVPMLTEGGRNFVVPSQLKTKPKFLNVRELFNYDRDPMLFTPVRDVIDQLKARYDFQTAAGRLYDLWKNAAEGGAPLTLHVPGADEATGNASAANASAPDDVLRIWAPSAELNKDKQMVLTGTPKQPVRVEVFHGRSPVVTYTCEAVDVQLSSNDFSGAGIGATLNLRDNVMRTDHIHRIGPNPSGSVTVSDVELPPSVRTVVTPSAITLLQDARESDVDTVRKLAGSASDQIAKLFRTIKSELHSRGSFSLSCLMLVLFGAALGLLLQGKNPLAVFVVGFAPAILLVLLITAGRMMTEGAAKNATVGISLIWAGNVVLLVLVAAVYTKLLKT